MKTSKYFIPTVFAIIFVFILTEVFFYQISRRQNNIYSAPVNSPEPSSTLSPLPSSPSNCIKADQSGNRHQNVACCPGLKDILCNGRFCDFSPDIIHCSNCGNGTCDTFEDIDNCPQDCGRCISANQIGNSFKGQNCCPGLKSVLYPCSGKPPNCTCSRGGTSVHCTNCGNGTCDIFENSCNCPVDCKL